MQFKIRMMLGMALVMLALGACYNPENPQELNAMDPTFFADKSTQVAAWDVQLGDLDDPAEMAKLARVDVFIAPTWQFWESNIDMDKIRMANPDIKIIAYFRPTGIRKAWREAPAGSYTNRLYHAALPYLSYTTTGDTASNWPGTYIYNLLDPEARAAVFQVFQDFQASSPNKFDGIFYDYFPTYLWVPADLDGVDGDPDLDGDGIAHKDDPDEIQAFLDGEDGWVDEVRAAMGEDFIQIANGVRAHRDSTFAAKLDGAFYEDFPAQAWWGPQHFRMALDPNEFNNLFTARNWFRTGNGGPWLILSHKNSAGVYFDSDLNPVYVDGGRLARAIAMLTDGTSITFEGFGVHDVGIPSVEYNLGPALGGVTIDGDIYTREFRDGSIKLIMRSGEFPFPFDFCVYRQGEVIDQSEYPAATD